MGVPGSHRHAQDMVECARLIPDVVTANPNNLHNFGTRRNQIQPLEPSI
ncbi:hypothetical protein [Kingella kingae]|nr:hypothetical protein [Kingella kingae]